jgi:hypothetical protein
MAPFTAGVTVAGEKLQVLPLGSPEHERPTAALNVPPVEETPTVKLLEEPRVTLLLVGDTQTIKSAPVPLSATLWGLPVALSVIVKVP